MKLTILALLSTFCYIFYIRYFSKMKQYERQLGLESHKKKNGTITAGGLFFAFLPFCFCNYTSKVIPIVLCSGLFAILGFIDDFFIIKFKKNDGIPVNLKLLFQVIISAIAFYFYLKLDMPTSISFFGYDINIKWVYGMLILFILVASTNAFNLTDGIDGLCGGISLLMGIPFYFVAILKGEYEISFIILSLEITLFVFWCFNFPKAYLFMGDTGSLFLGAFYAMVGIILNELSMFFILALPYIFETLSVIIQVLYFKLTKGKRFFKMAPFHHHLEEKGYSELKIDLIFYMIELFLILIVYFFKIY